MDAFHFLRPLWLFAFIPLLLLAWYLLKQKPVIKAWSEVCDPHLLHHLIKAKRVNTRTPAIALLFSSAFFIIVSLAGPTWSQYPAPIFKSVQPRVVVLDMSNAMIEDDLSPSRLSRAKFKLHDLFKIKNQGQFGMVVFTSEPFIVSPLTDDAQTIDALLSSLTTEVMPVEGHRLDRALNEAGKLITQAGFHQGDILVLTAETPDSAAIAAAKALAQKGMQTSVLPIRKQEAVNPLFKQLATTGQGQLLTFSDTSHDLLQWLQKSHDNNQLAASLLNHVPVWKDQGRWFLIPSLLLLLPVFRRRWLQRIAT